MSMRMGERGSATIEFALVVPVLLLLFFGALNLAFSIQRSMAVADAAYAGAKYGASTTYHSTDLTGMQTAATNSALGIGGLTPVASSWCTCVAGGVTVTCSSTCSGYGVPLKYVKVQVTATIAPFLPMPGLPGSIPLSATAILRVQ